MKKRVAGIMRVKNEGPLICKCIDSCITALDELIVVYNDCTDNSADEIEKMAKKYPDKIRYYEYQYEIRAFNLTRKEYDNLKKSPEDTPCLLSSYYNFALSKVTAEYALKIDADQLYFTSKLKEWCDFVRNCNNEDIKFNKGKVFLGKIFKYWVSAYLTYSRKIGIILPLMPTWLVSMMYPAYLYYAKWAFSRDEVCLSMSGVNVFETDKTLISMAHAHPSGDNVMPSPFNGVGDHLIFKMSKEVKFRKFTMDEYNKDDSDTFCIIEELVHPCKRLAYIGFFWKHIRTMRALDKQKVQDAYQRDPQSFLDIESFKKLKYCEILRHAKKHIFLPVNRILFGFIYKANKSDLFKSLESDCTNA